jgi:hypothetical protein
MKRAKQYCIGVRSSADSIDPPRIVKFEIHEAGAREILRLSEIAKSNDLYRIEKFDWRATYLRDDPRNATDDTDDDDIPVRDTQSSEGNEITMDTPTLNVSDDEFWFAASMRDDDIEVVSTHVPIRELIEHFDLTQSTVSGITQRTETMVSLLQSADDTGCAADLIVVSKSALRAAADAVLGDEFPSWLRIVI